MFNIVASSGVGVTYSSAPGPTKPPAPRPPNPDPNSAQAKKVALFMNEQRHNVLFNTCHISEIVGALQNRSLELEFFVWQFV